MKRGLIVALAALAAWAWAGAARAADPIVLCYHDVRDDVAGHVDADAYATSTTNLAAHFDWLRNHGYTVISLQQWLDARDGRGSLPDKPVLLSFDDGLKSVYTKVFPLLKAFHYPALAAVVGAWTDLPPGGTVDLGRGPVGPEAFASWRELREMQDSGLVEIASHTYDLHRGIPANPQGNLIPAVTTRRYDPAARDYETESEYRARLRADFTRSAAAIRAHLGRAPRVMVWPYGEYNPVAGQIAAAAGMPVSFTLGTRSGVAPADLQGVPRDLEMMNPDIGAFVWERLHRGRPAVIRAVQVDLDYVYDPDPAQQERNLGELIERIKRMGINQVWLQAFADPGGDDAAAAVYFPNRHLPMRADLLSRAVWQLRTRAGVDDVFAWMPVLAWRLPDAAQQQRLQLRDKSGAPVTGPVRLNPFLAETRQLVGDLYEDMAAAAPVRGLLFHDDAVLRDSDDLGPQQDLAPAERTRALIDFTATLQARAEPWRSGLRTARNLFAEPVLDPAGEAWTAQSLPAFLAAYDEIGLMAMPYMERAADPEQWLRTLAGKVSAVPGAVDKTVFELQAVDWRRGGQAVPTEVLTRQMQLLQVAGARHLGYYPDDFVRDNPALQPLRAVFSIDEQPAPPR